jgi:hypothetical protein
VSVSDLNIPRIGPHIFLRQIGSPDFLSLCTFLISESLFFSVHSPFISERLSFSLAIKKELITKRKKDTPHTYTAAAKLDLFWAQLALAFLVAISGPKKVSIFRAHPFQWPSKWICPHQNNYVPRHKQQVYINSYFVCTGQSNSTVL